MEVSTAGCVGAGEGSGHGATLWLGKQNARARSDFAATGTNSDVVYYKRNGRWATLLSPLAQRCLVRIAVAYARTPGSAGILLGQHTPVTRNAPPKELLQLLCDAGFAPQVWP